MGALLRRLVIFCFSLGLFLVDRLRRAALRIVGRIAPGSAVILYYHAVPDEYRARFAAQMDDVLRYAKPIHADDGHSLEHGDRYVAVTFEDGYQNVVDNAVPELLKRRIPCTIFIVTDALGRVPNWIGYSPASGGPIINEEKLKSIPSDFVKIGSHTLTHPILPRLTEASARNEIVASRARLQDILKQEVDLLSFPYGAFNESIVQMSRQAGYRRVFTTLPYRAYRVPEEYVVGRVKADPEDSVWEFRLKIAGAYRWLPFGFALKRKLFEGLGFGPYDGLRKLSELGSQD
jgi:peptidoglycan/xylan/chitin deacetylase (PgdA/CDA1 family)